MDQKTSDRPLLIALGGFISLSAIMGIGRFVYTPILPFMEAEFGLTKPQAGVIASANYLAYVIGALLAAYIRLPGGRWAWAMASIALSAVTTASMGLTQDYAHFILLRFVSGLASAFGLILVSSLVLDRLSLLGRSGLSSLFFGGVGFGIALSALLVALIDAEGLSSRAMWLVSGMYATAALLIVMLLLPRDDIMAAAVSSEGPAPKKGEPRALAALIAGYGLYGFGYVITVTFLTVIVRDNPLLRTVETEVWLMVGIAAIPSVAFWAFIAKHRSMGIAIGTALIVESISVGLTVMSSEPAVIVFAAALFGGTFMGIAALGLVYSRELSAKDPRRTVGLMTVAFGTGQMIGPTVAGFAYDLAGSFFIPSMMAAAALLIAAGLVLFVPPSEGKS